MTHAENYLEKQMPASYETVDWTVHNLPRLDDVIKFEFDDDKLFWKLEWTVDTRTLEMMNKYISDMDRILDDACMDFLSVVKNYQDSVKWIRWVISDLVKKHVNEKYPEFMEMVQKDKNDRYEKHKKENDEKISALSDEQKEMLRSKLGL